MDSWVGFPHVLEEKATHALVATHVLEVSHVSVVMVKMHDLPDAMFDEIQFGLVEDLDRHALVLGQLHVVDVLPRLCLLDDVALHGVEQSHQS